MTTQFTANMFAKSEMEIGPGDVVSFRVASVGKTMSLLDREPATFCLSGQIESHTPAPKPLKLEVGCRVRSKVQQQQGFVLGLFGEGEFCRAWVSYAGGIPITCPVGHFDIIGPASNPYNLSIGSKIVVPSGHPRFHEGIGIVISTYPAGHGGRIQWLNGHERNFDFKDLLPAPSEPLHWENECVAKSKVDGQMRIVISHYQDEFWGRSMTGLAIGISRKRDFDVVKAAPRP